MHKVLLFLFLFSLLHFTAFSQSISASHDVTPQEAQTGFVVQKMWLEHYALPKLLLSNQTYKTVETLSESLDKNAATLQPDMILGKELKRPFVFVRIPVYKNESGNSIQQLQSFEVKLMEENTIAPLLNSSAKTTAAASVLATGAWYKISLTERGIYRIDYDFLKNKLGINPDQISPAMMRVFGNGGTMLHEDNAIAHPDDLQENAIEMHDGGDGTFNPGDYFLFYANGTMDWVKDSINQKFVNRKNLYEDRSYYFLNFDGGIGERIETQTIALTPNTIVTDYNDYMVHEQDDANPGKFGKEWWGDEMSLDPNKGQTKTFSFPLGNLTEDAAVEILVGSRSVSPNNVFSISMNGQLLGSYTLGSIGLAETDIPLTVKTANYTLPVQNNAGFSISYTPAATSGKGYLNYIRLNTRRQLSMHDGQFTFRDWKSTGAGNVAKYTIGGSTNNVHVWDVTQPLTPKSMNGNFSGNQYSFSQDAESLHEFVAFDGSNFKTPEYSGTVANQNLHGSPQVDYVIVTAPQFLNAANKLADFHRQHRNLRVLVAATQQVYNEFGSGSQDISAIRDFARMFYLRAGNDTTQMPRYLLLFGDASYDYKDRVAGNTNFVPTFETAESLQPLSGFCTDDFFSFLDDNENIESGAVANTMDLGVGRIPVQTADEAMNVVDKIMGYAAPKSLGPWRISTTIATDDYDNAGNHLSDGEVMASTINSFSQLYNHTKVYIDALQKVATPAGDRCPDANKIIDDGVYKGTFLINYNGHGSGQTLAHERILSQDDFNNWKNLDRLPIMVTATCEFSKYDNPEFNSAGEKLLVKGDGGAIALLTTTQLVYADLNREMNSNFLRAMFRQYNGEWPAFGDAFRFGKNVTYAVVTSPWSLANFRKFALLGDPALVPAFPKHKVVTDAVLDGNTLQTVDSIRALGKYQIKGSIQDVNDNLLSDFNGNVYITIYDKPKNVATKSPQPIPFFQTQSNIIYKGKVTVSSGKFSFLFIAPKDLNYDFGKGKISYYAENGITDAAGGDTTVTIGGFSDNPIEDDNAPIVKPFINDTLFRDGGITGSNTLLYVQLNDESGINVSGNSVGHDLVAILDEEVQNPFLLNDYYETATNDFTRGYVFFPIKNLSEGRHSLRVKAWDINNNSGEGTVNFEVVNGNVMQVRNLMNYPNPFADNTRFVFEHNHPEEALNVQINIYNTSGGLVRSLTKDYTPGGSRSNEIMWDGTGDNGSKLPSGMYVYRMIINTDKGNKATAYQKLVIIR